MSDSVDVAVHPFVTHPDELREYMKEPWRSRTLPNPVNRGLYIPPFPQFPPEHLSPTGLPASDPARVRAELIDRREMSRIVLLPLGRGLLPDTRHEVAIAAATNDWLAARWLDHGNADGRVKGSIRVCPRAPREAVREIERWAGHPHFVQVAVPLEAHQPYGVEVYFPIWDAAARHGLPVAVHSEGNSSGVELAPTPVGFPTHFTEGFAITPSNGMFPLASLICEGVFERLDGLRFVFADGGFDVCSTLLWRLDKDWKATRSEIPWTLRKPSDYLTDHVRFVLTRWDGPSETGLKDLAGVWDGSDLLLYGSNFPYWDDLPVDQAADRIPADWRSRVLGANAADLYGFGRAD